MAVLFMKRGMPVEPPPSKAIITITGSGNGTNCYIQVNGTKYSSAGGIEVTAGDIITFGVYGRSTTYYGEVTIDGVQVIKPTGAAIVTYEWEVPARTKLITMTMSYTSTSSQRNGRITVTTSKQELPANYTKYKYIQASGAQYINTGINPNSNTRVVCDFQVTTIDATNRCIFGVVGQFSFRKYTDTVFRTCGTGNVNMSTEIAIGDRHIVDKTGTLTTVDEKYTASTSAASCSYPLFLFAYNGSGTASAFGNLKMWSCKIYNSTLLSRFYIPCANPDGVVGMFDAISQTFYPNAGTGAFIGG